MSQISVKFDTEQEEINKQLFLFASNITIKEMLNNFLQQTNSKIELHSDNIQFIYKGKILNTPSFLDKKVGEIFRLSNHKVKVMDSKNIIGGEKLFHN
jgi:hypothetical protein